MKSFVNPWNLVQPASRPASIQPLHSAPARQRPTMSCSALQVSKYKSSSSERSAAEAVACKLFDAAHWSSYLILNQQSVVGRNLNQIGEAWATPCPRTFQSHVGISAKQLKQSWTTLLLLSYCVAHTTGQTNGCSIRIHCVLFPHPIICRILMASIHVWIRSQRQDSAGTRPLFPCIAKDVPLRLGRHYNVLAFVWVIGAKSWARLLPWHSIVQVQRQDSFICQLGKPRHQCAAPHVKFIAARCTDRFSCSSVAPRKSQRKSQNVHKAVSASFKGAQ